MVGHLYTAAKVAGVTYRLLTTTTLIGLLFFGIVDAVRSSKKRN